MKSNEFMYWLQGFFELHDVTVLNEKQIKTIKNHLSMAELTDKNGMLPFCYWLKGFFEALEDNLPSASQVNILKNKLNALFEHVVSEVNVLIRTATIPDNTSRDSYLIKC